MFLKYQGGPDSFDPLRKRTTLSIGWCRICKIDCESVEGLDMHGQTREHRRMDMDMVISIKQKNAKKQKTIKDHRSSGCCFVIQDGFWELGVSLDVSLQGSLWEHDGDVILEKLKTYDLFIYSGHCNGLKYILERGAALAKLNGCATASLMSCMSGLLRLQGPYNPTGAILDYLLTGVIGNLGKVYPSRALFLYDHFGMIKAAKANLDEVARGNYKGRVCCFLQESHQLLGEALEPETFLN